MFCHYSGILPVFHVPLFGVPVFLILKHAQRCTKFLFQSFFWPLDQKRRRRNFKVQRSNAVLVIQKSVLISVNEFVLSEMGENLSL